MKKNICKVLIIMTAMAFGLAGCSAEAKVERQLELGASSMEAGDYDKAIEAYEEVVSLDKYEIEGYKGLVIAMDADERDNAEIIQVVKDATEAISEIKESEEGLSEEDEAAAKDLYVVAVEAVDSNTDDQVTVLENAVEVIGEDGMLPDDFKGMLEHALADNVLNGMDTTLAYVEMLEKLLLGDEMPQVEEESEETSTEEVTEESQEASEENNAIPTDFAAYVCLGPNADYPDTMLDYEFLLNGQLFRVSLPNDVCADFEWDDYEGVLDIYNADKSKKFTALVDRAFLTDDEWQYLIDTIYEIELDVIHSQNDDIFCLIYNTDQSKHNVFDHTTSNGLQMFYSDKVIVYDSEKGADVQTHYGIFYSDTNRPNMDDMQILNSFVPISVEESVIINSGEYTKL